MNKRRYFKGAHNMWINWRKKIIITTGLLIMTYLLASLILGEMGLVKYYRMKAQYNMLTEEIARLKIDNAKLRKNVYALRNDPAYVERIARDKLGLARPGEIVYYYGEP